MVDANDQRRARLNCIAHLLSLIPYEEVPRRRSSCPSASLLTATKTRVTRTALSRSATEVRPPCPRPSILAGDEERSLLDPADRPADALRHACDVVPAESSARRMRQILH